ncbi:MAG: hypothetical protein ACYDEN_15005 [Acidimicrobiales bacterium]
MASTGSLTTGGVRTEVPRPGDRRPAADRVMRRLLRVPERRPASPDGAHRIFSVGIVLSALRCLLTYIFLPILAPVLGVAGSVGPSVGIPLAVVALTFDVMGIRRFWLADHRWRWTMTVIYLLVMGLVVTLLVGNLETLFR